MEAYRRPGTLAEALALMADAPLPLAGGTDVYPAEAQAAAWMQARPRPLLDLSGIAGLGAIEDRGDHMRIGALVTWGALRDAALPPWFAALQAASRQVGGAQVQNRATLVGNLCNASPAADGVPVLLALEASVEIAGPAGARVLSLRDFLLGPRRTALGPGDLVVAVLVPHRPAGTRARFEKLGARAYLVISIVMVAAVLEVAEGRIGRARVAVGACSPVALRLPALEAALIGVPVESASAVVREAHLAGLSPIDDVRASAAYRRQAALVLLRRALAA